MTAIGGKEKQRSKKGKWQTSEVIPSFCPMNMALQLTGRPQGAVGIRSLWPLWNHSHTDFRTRHCLLFTWGQNEATGCFCPVLLPTRWPARTRTTGHRISKVWVRKGRLVLTTSSSQEKIKKAENQCCWVEHGHFCEVPSEILLPDLTAWQHCTQAEPGRY